MDKVPARAGQAEGSTRYWLGEDDFLWSREEPLAVERLGALGFPRDWPGVYSSNPIFKSLVGKKGKCAGQRVSVVGLPDANDRERIGGVQLQPLQSFANAEEVEKRAGLPVVRGFAVFERLDGPPGADFVAERFWWNQTPDGAKWLDFTPRPQAWPSLLLVQSIAGSAKTRSALSASHTRLAASLLRERGLGGESAGPAATLSAPSRLRPVTGEQEDDDELRLLRAELDEATREADEACAELRRLEAEVAKARQQPRAPRANCGGTTAGIQVGALVRVLRGQGRPIDLEGQEVVATSRDVGSGHWAVRLRTGELRSVPESCLVVVQEAKDEPQLSTFGCEVFGSLPVQFGAAQYNLWPLVYSGLVCVRVPDSMLARLNAKVDALVASRSAPSHALFLQAEMKEGKQFTVQDVDKEYKALLLACAKKLAIAASGDEAHEWKYAIDTVWTVHQMAGDYNPVHFHTNQRSHFGFSSFLHLQLPPQLNLGRHQLPKPGGSAQHDGTTSFFWKADANTGYESLEGPGILECEFLEGYLYVFPQWVQHYVWPFRGPGERRTIAGNVSLVDHLDAGRMAQVASGDLGDPRRAVRVARYFT